MLEMTSTFKVTESASGFYALSLSSIEGMAFSDQSSIQEIKREGGGAYGSIIFAANTIINDFIVTGTKTIWAIDALGHLHCSRHFLNQDNVDPELRASWNGKDGSIRYFSDDVPVCIEGEDDNLWIATHQGSLVHYDGITFTESEIKLIGSPIRIRRFEDDYFCLMTNKGEIYQYRFGFWRLLPLSDDIPQDITINDVANVNGKLYAVSITGYVLKLSDDQIFEALNYQNISWFGCVSFNKKLHLAGNKDGAFEMDETGNIKALKVYDQMVGVYPGIDCLYFMLAESRNGTFVRYAPHEPKPWIKLF